MFQDILFEMSGKTPEGPSLSLTGTKPWLSQSGAITPHELIQTRAIHKPFKSISEPHESLKVTNCRDDGDGAR
jgi:hypothetical protein